MIRVSQVLKTAVGEHGSSRFRICTGEALLNYHSDDILISQEVSDDVIKVQSVSDVQRIVFPQLVFNWLFALFLLVGACMNFYCGFVLCLSASGFQLNLNVIFGCATAALFVAQLRSCISPIVHDSCGHWVNLRSGDTNLCGGITMQKKVG